MTEEDQNYDAEEAAEALQEVAEYFEQIGSYDIEDLKVDEEYELLRDAIGAIGAFSTQTEALHEYTDGKLPEDYEDAEIRDRVMQVGVAWPDAKKAYEAISQISEEVSDKVEAAAVYGVNFDAVAQTAEELSDVQRQYHEAEARAEAESQMLGPEGHDTPVDVALEFAEDEEVVSHLEGIQEEIPRTQEESREQLQELIAEVQ